MISSEWERLKAESKSNSDQERFVLIKGAKKLNMNNGIYDGIVPALATLPDSPRGPSFHH